MANATPTDAPAAATTTTVKTKTSDVERLKALALKIAKSIVKNPLEEKAREELSKVAQLLYSTVNHAELLSDHSKTTSEEVD